MIIIDGKKGPLKVGRMPLYLVPRLILDLLIYDEPAILDYPHSFPEMRVRPLPGLYFNVLKDGKIDICKEPPFSKSCQKSAQWLQDVTMVSNDLVIGQQFTRIKHAATDAVADNEIPGQLLGKVVEAEQMQQKNLGIRLNRSSV